MSSLANRLKRSFPYRAARAVYYIRGTDRYRRFRQRVLRSDARILADYLQSHDEPKLQIGCGENPLPDWLNTDYLPDREGVVHLDATRRFPFAADSFELVFTEHVIEHLPLQGGINLVREAFRTLKRGGRLRVSTPPMEFIIDCYKRPSFPANRAYLDWHFLAWNPDAPVRDPVVFANDFVRMWGHLFIYDEPLLRRIIHEAGFVDVRRYRINESGDPRLIGLENDSRMPPGMLQLSTLTLEGTKPNT